MSRIRTNLITNRMANGAPTVSNGLVISGVTTVTTLDLNGDLDVDGHLNADNVSIAGVCTATTFSGSGASLTNLNASAIASGTVPTARLGSGTASSSTFLAGDSTYKTVTGTTINSNADNRVITGSGTANTLNAETNVVIDSTGRLLVGTGHSASRNVGDLTAKIQLEGTGYAQSSLSLMSNAGASAGNTPHLTLGKSRGSSNGSNTIIADDDALGQIQFAGADGTDCNSVAASIIGRVDGAPGSNDMPGRLVFSTTDDGAAAPTERVQIKSGGGLVSSKGGSIAFSDGYSAIEARAPEGTTQLTVTNTTYESGSFDNEAGIWFKGNYSGNNERAKSAIIHKNTGDYGVGDLYFCIDGNADNSNATVSDVKMKITSNGYVTMPNTPAASAYVSSSSPGAANNKIQNATLGLNNTHYNNGGHFNTSNYRFTCPVAGYYKVSFSTNLHTSNHNDGQNFQVNLQVNGSTRHIHYDTKQSSHTWLFMGWAETVYCSANDYISLSMAGNAQLGVDSSSAWNRTTFELIG